MRIPRFTAVILATLPISVAHAEIYACKTATGTIVYQNFTCDHDSSGVAGPATTTQTAPSSNATKAVTAGPWKSAATNGPHKASSGSTGPRLGMSPDEVKAIWGEPSNVYQDELVDGRVEIWTYEAGRSVHFNALHRAVLIDG